jgi:hypothetical protein
MRQTGPFERDGSAVYELPADDIGAGAGEGWGRGGWRQKDLFGGDGSTAGPGSSSGARGGGDRAGEDEERRREDASEEGASRDGLGREAREGVWGREGEVGVAKVIWVNASNRRS